MVLRILSRLKNLLGDDLLTRYYDKQEDIDNDEFDTFIQTFRKE